MKKLGCSLFVTLFLICSAAFSVFAAGGSVETVDKVPLSREQTTAEFTITVQNADAYAGAEFGLQCAQGVRVTKVVYDQSNLSYTPPTEARGIVWFSFFAGDNRFQGPVTATVTLEYGGQTDSAVALQYVSIYHRDTGAVEEELLRPNRQILLDREGDGTPVAPLDPPDGAKPNPPTDSSSSNSSAQPSEPSSSASPSNPGSSEAVGSQGEETGSSVDGGTSSGSSGDGSSLSEGSSDPNNPATQDVGNISSNGSGYTALLLCLCASVALNLVLGYFIIKSKRMKEGSEE